MTDWSSPTVGSLFAGIGGADLAVAHAFGDAVTIWQSDISPTSEAVRAAHFPHARQLGDITSIDWARVELVNVLTDTFPCQELSQAGRRAGLKAPRSGLWFESLKAIEALRPALVVIENTDGIRSTKGEAAGDLGSCPWCVGGGHRCRPAFAGTRSCSRRLGRGRVRRGVGVCSCRTLRARRRRADLAPARRLTPTPCPGHRLRVACRRRSGRMGGERRRCRGRGRSLWR